MIVPSSTRLALFASIIALGIVASARADDYRDKQRNFTLTLPAGWGNIPPPMITQMNATARLRMPGVNINYTAGFQPIDQAPMQLPYCLVQVLPTPGGGTSYDDIEAALAKEYHSAVKKAEGAYADLIKNAAVNTPVLDRAHNRFVTHMELDVAGIGKGKGLSVGFLGSKNTILIHCYARANEFDAHLPTFQALLDSFKFDPGYAFTPGSGSSFAGNVAGGALRGALIGGIVGGLVGVPLYFWSRWKKKSAPPEDNPFALRRG